MNLALLGYGKMGKEIERWAEARGWRILVRLNSQSKPVTTDQVDDVQAGIHFATASAVLTDVQHWAGLKKNLVIGTTGWQQDLNRVREIVAGSGIGVVYSSNFSLGVNLFGRIVRAAGTLIDKFSEYDVAIHETHHLRKADSPSGTALSLARILMEEVKRKREILTGPPQGPIRPEQLQVSSTRVGEVIGEHSILLDSSADSISLTHTAKNRAGFALGALVAAEWIQTHRGMFTMDDVLEDLFSS